MSQYPSPYNPTPFPPNYGYYAPMGNDPLAPARRASLLLIVLGILAILMAFCVGVSSQMMDQILAQGAMPPEAMNGMSPEQMKRQLMLVSVVVAVAGAVTLLVGIIARRGTRGPVIAALSVSILASGILALNFLGTLALAAMHSNPLLFMSACIGAVPTLGYALAVIWLIAALRKGGSLMLAQQQYQMHLWQMQQQQAWQQSGGYGYALPNAPQAPPAPAPAQAPDASPQEPPQPRR